MDLKEFLKQKEGWKYKPYEDIGGKLIQIKLTQIQSLTND